MNPKTIIFPQASSIAGENDDSCIAKGLVWNTGFDRKHCLEIHAVPDKVCPGNCPYCPYGPTSRATINRECFFLTEKIIHDLERRLCRNGPVQNIVICGPGEATLHSDLRAIISGIKKTTAVPVTVASCGGLLWMKGVQQDLQNADSVSANIDAADKNVFHAINQYQVQIPYLRFVNGLFEFRSRFRGEFTVNVSLVDGINSHESHVAALAAMVKNLAPKQIMVRTFVPADRGLKTVSADIVRLQYLASYFGPKVRVVNHGAAENGVRQTKSVRKENLC